MASSELEELELVAELFVGRLVFSLLVGEGRRGWERVVAVVVVYVRG